MIESVIGKTLDEVRGAYAFNGSCQNTARQALTYPDERLAALYEEYRPLLMGAHQMTVQKSRRGE